jgi:hypothetical protein
MHYFILAASKDRAQLFEVSGGKIQPHAIEGMPTSMADAWKGMERVDGSINFHGSGPGASGAQAMFHGQGGAKDVQEQEEDQYMHALAKSLHTFLHGQHVPLIFAGVAEEYGMFKKFDQSGALVEEYIRGNPDQIPMEELKEKAEPIVREYIMKKNEGLVEEYGNLLGTGRTSTDKDAILAAAEAGKVDLLLITEGHEQEAAELTTHTVAHRGRVAIMAEGKIPENATIAAILRY